LKRKGKIRHTFYLSKRLYKVLCNIAPLYRDFDLPDPSRGSMTKALEDMIQFYSESKEYQNKIKKREDNVKMMFDYLCKKDREYINKTLKELSKN